jgi:antitoxin MazE
MTTKLISIGNSKGVRIPKSMIEEYQLNENNIELRAEENGILILPVKTSRIGWEEKFANAVKKAKRKREKDTIDIQNDFDKTEWTW